MEDVTYDPEPVMVRAGEVDAAVQAMLDKEVGSSHRAWDDKLIKRCAPGWGWGGGAWGLARCAGVGGCVFAAPCLGAASGSVVLRCACAGTALKGAGWSVA
jgi:hypothetical protein